MGHDAHQLWIREVDYVNHQDLCHISLELHGRFGAFCLLHEHEDGHEYVNDEYGEHHLCDDEGVVLKDRPRTHGVFLYCDEGLQCLFVPHQSPSQRRCDFRRYF